VRDLARDALEEHDRARTGQLLGVSGIGPKVALAVEESLRNGRIVNLSDLG
jgi:Holliday junction resolvasome RuvABC DNA-binding subunit